MSDPEMWLSLLTLTLMEIVLGIDNIIFLSILTDRLPAGRQATARHVGLALALVGRLGLLFAVGWIMTLDRTALLSVPGTELAFTGKDLILLGGGLFLLGKSTHEIYHKLEGPPHGPAPGAGTATFGSVLVQILIMDLVFSIDSVITAVGMAQSIVVMAVAMVLAVAVMLVFAGAISGFVNRHPSMKILALSFLILIGVMLVAEGMGRHIGKGYIYFAMAFSLGVELINMRLRKKYPPVELREKLNPPVEEPAGPSPA